MEEEKRRPPKKRVQKKVQPPTNFIEYCDHCKRELRTNCKQYLVDDCRDAFEAGFKATDDKVNLMKKKVRSHRHWMCTKAAFCDQFDNELFEEL